MFCKVCKDAGKNETEYTSHWVRDAPGPNGKVVCPTLLSQKCKYCRKYGHTPKHCSNKYWDNHNPSNNNISTVKVTYKSTPATKQLRQNQRARELCSSPPPVSSGEEKTMKIMKSNVVTKTTTPHERNDSPTPLLPVSSPPKKNPRVKEEEEEEEEKEKLWCGGCKRLYEYECSEECKGTPPPSPQQEEAQAPIGKKSKNYFELLKMDEEDDEKTTRVIPTTLKPDYLAIEKSGVENANKEAQLQNYKENLEKNFPTLNPKTSFTATNSKKPTTATEAKSYLQVARTYLCDEHGNPLPRGRGYEEICHGCGQVCLAFCNNEWCDGNTRLPQTCAAMEEMRKWEEERRRNANTSPPPTINEKDAKCSKCIPGKYGCSKCYPDCPSPSSSPPPDCLGTPSLSPTPPPTTTMTTTSWADMEI